jgi:hypothetical protein
MLVVRSCDDDRLYHLIGPAKQYRWQTFMPESANDHDHCGICWHTFAGPPTSSNHSSEGYAAAGDIMGWLCPECLDEIRDHFGIAVIGGPLDDEPAEHTA